MKTLRIRVEVDPALVEGLPSQCVAVLRKGVLVSPCYRGVRIYGACLLPIVACSLGHAVAVLHDDAEMCERLADAPRAWPPELAGYDLWLRDVAAFYRLVAEILVQRSAKLWPDA